MILKWLQLATKFQSSSAIFSYSIDMYLREIWIVDVQPLNKAVFSMFGMT
jgi:hypothetical protein